MHTKARPTEYQKPTSKDINNLLANVPLDIRFVGPHNFPSDEEQTKQAMFHHYQPLSGQTIDDGEMSTDDTCHALTKTGLLVDTSLGQHVDLMVRDTHMLPSEPPDCRFQRNGLDPEHYTHIAPLQQQYIPEQSWTGLQVYSDTWSQQCTPVQSWTSSVAHQVNSDTWSDAGVDCYQLHLALESEFLEDMSDLQRYTPKQSWTRLDIPQQSELGSSDTEFRMDCEDTSLLHTIAPYDGTCEPATPCVLGAYCYPAPITVDIGEPVHWSIDIFARNGGTPQDAVFGHFNF